MSDSAKGRTPLTLEKVRDILLLADDGLACEDEIAAAVAFVKTSANAGDTYAHYILANWHTHELYGFRNVPELIEQHLRAAVAGLHAEALYDYGVWCRENGRGNKVAFGYFVASALAGDEEGLYNAIACLEQGIGVYKNEEIAQVLSRIYESRHGPL
jgi:hypothetical protein